MQIVINENEIIEAIKDYVAGQGIATIGRKIEVELKNGRAPSGTTATIEILKVPSGETGNQKVDNFDLKTDKDVAVEKAVDQVEQIVEEESKETPPEKPEKEDGEEKAEAPATTGSDVDALFG